MDRKVTVLAEDHQVVYPFLAAPLICSVVDVQPALSATRLAGVTGASQSAPAPLCPLRSLEVIQVRHRAEGLFSGLPSRPDLFIVQLVERDLGTAAQSEVCASSVEPRDQKIGGFVVRVLPFPFGIEGVQKDLVSRWRCSSAARRW